MTGAFAPTYAGLTWAGRRNAATSPMSPNAARTISATAYDRVPRATTETRIVPAIAVPKVEPRLDTLRERPEISPWSASGKLDCTTFTDGVSITPRPRPMRRRPGTNATTREELWTKASKSPIPARVTTNPETMRVRCENFFASRAAAKDETSTPTVAAVNTTPVPMALYPRTVWRKTDTTNDTP